MDDVVARQGGGFAVALDERAETDEYGENVSPGGRMGEKPACGFEDKLDLFFEGTRLEAENIAFEAERSGVCLQPRRIRGGR